MNQIKIITVFGTRPEIVKLSPVIPLLDSTFNHVIVHTGQHYDYNMDEIFFRDLQLRKPDYNLGVGSGSHVLQTTKMMVQLEEIFVKEKPDVVIACTDTNSPLATVLVASKLGIPVIHFEAGCRSFNKQMPEEINRVVADHCSELLLAPDNTAQQNLLREGFDRRMIQVVGSTAVEAVQRNRLFAKKSNLLEHLQLKENYAVVTLHRAENTNSLAVLTGLVEAINQVATMIKIIVPIHPRTKKKMEEFNLAFTNDVTVVEPLGYLDFLHLLDNALFTMTDSGGVQEEAAALDVPCLILRNETEWTYLTDLGKNVLLGTEKEHIIHKVNKLLESMEGLQNMVKIKLPEIVKPSEKIVMAIQNYCGNLK